MTFTASSANDPFSQIFSALWTLAENSKPLTSMVSISNRIKYHDKENRDPNKSIIEAADVPELLLAVLGVGDVNLHDSSSTSRVERTFAWMIATGDKRVNEFLNPLEFALYAAMADWKNVLASLQWNGKGFVRKVNWTSAATVIDDAKQSRNLRGWTAVWSVSVDCYFATADLIAFNSQS